MRVPLLKGYADQSSLNHMNALLQSLYHLCPLRHAVFESTRNSEPISDSSLTNPLDLVFAKMHYSLQNREEITDASIYFKYLTNTPNEFYSLITRDLFESAVNYRSLLQWDVLTVQRTPETDSEVTIAEQFHALPIDSNSFASVQCFLDDFFKIKTEQVFVNVNGENRHKTLQVLKQLSFKPTIATFLLSKHERDFIIEELIYVYDEEEVFNLSSVILFYPHEERFSACLKGKDSFWYMIQDDSVVRISTELALINASAFGYMLFYINGEAEADESLCSTKPNHQLIVESLTKNNIHAISRTVQKQQNSNSPPVKPANVSIKSKNMSNGQLNQVFLASPSSPSVRFPISSRYSPLTMTQPRVEMELLNEILVPADLSRVKMNLLTKELSPIESIEIREEEQINDFDLFTSLQTNDVELEYFENIHVPAHKSRSNEQPAQKQSHQERRQRSDTFAGLMDFDEVQSVAEDEDETVLQTTMASVCKTRIDDESGKPASFRLQYKKQAQSTLATGLLYRTAKAVYALNKEDDEEEDQKEYES